MATRSTRFRLSAIVVLWLVGSLPGTALADTTWYSGCSGQASANYVCVYNDRDFIGTHGYGHWFGSLANYQGDHYPNTNGYVNDTASSVMNLYTTRDVTWHNEPNQGGAGFCVNPNTVVSWVGLFSNDAFSSHQLAADNTAC